MQPFCGVPYMGYPTYQNMGGMGYPCAPGMYAGCPPMGGGYPPISLGGASIITPQDQERDYYKSQLGQSEAGLKGRDSGEKVGGGLGALGGAGFGAAVGFAITGCNPIGAAVGALVGGIAGLVGGAIFGASSGKSQGQANSIIRDTNDNGFMDGSNVASTFRPQNYNMTHDYYPGYSGTF